MLKLEHISKRYQYQRVLDDISLQLPVCGLIAIVGPSGCGKSTLLHIMGGIDKNFQGEIFWNERAMKHHLSTYRRQHVSFIFQQFHLIMWLSSQSNIELPHFFYPHSYVQNRLDIKEFSHLKMSSLSHGQRQRLAYLRATYQKSDLLLCDEPTGSLDPCLATQVMELLKEESQERLVVLVSHDEKLVHQYSDEIYKMQDGEIVDHTILHQIPAKKSVHKKKRKKYLSCFYLALLSICSHKARSLQLIVGMTLSLLCILLTFTMSRGLEEQIHQYIYSIIPPSGISFQMSQHQSLTQEICLELEQYSFVEKAHLYLDDYECLGIGFVEERYQESQVVFIGDDTAPFQHLSLERGRYPEADHEIIVSLSTAQHLCGSDSIDQLIGKKVYAWYQHDNDVKSITYHIVGISQQMTTLDTIYQKSNAYIHLLKDVYMFDETLVQSQLGIVYVHPDYQRSEVIRQLKTDYPTYQFLEIGASTNQKVSDTMQQVQTVLLLFSALAILSSLFLIGEVMFLNVVQKRKDFAIMKCYGATSFDLLKIVMCESLLIIGFAQILTTLQYKLLLSVVNMFLKETLLMNQVIFSFDYMLLINVYIGAFGIVFCSQLPPFFYVFKINTIRALKD